MLVIWAEWNRRETRHLMPFLNAQFDVCRFHLSYMYLKHYDVPFPRRGIMTSLQSGSRRHSCYRYQTLFINYPLYPCWVFIKWNVTHNLYTALVKKLSSSDDVTSTLSGLPLWVCLTLPVPCMRYVSYYKSCFVKARQSHFDKI